ncbi:MAG: uracil-DNA glycosylase [Candidatus Syntropharchaeales archaeon]
MGIANLVDEIKSCRKCRLSETRKNALCGEGDLNADLMLIAQAPGEREDNEGRMFIGPSGKVLDKLLKIAKIDREEIYMTNLIKCMLPGYRRPRPDEIEICGRYVDQEIELIDPVILAPLGYYATRYTFERYGLLLPAKGEFHRVFGEIFLSDDGSSKIIPLQHPAALLYNPSIEEEMIRNYRKAGLLMKACR